MIETDRLVNEMLSAISYAEQTLRLHPEKAAVIQRYLKSEKLRMGKIIQERPDSIDVFARCVIW